MCGLLIRVRIWLRIDKNPNSFLEAMESVNYDKWLNAMKEELKSMDHNDVWEFFKLTKGCKWIGCKWV